MPRLVHKLPSSRQHKPSGQAVVTLGSKDVFLGAYGTSARCAEYNRIVAEWLADGRRLASSAPGRSDHWTESDVILRY